MDARLGAGQPLAEAAALGRTFGARQVGRMETVGCKDPGMNIVPTMDSFQIHIVASRDERIIDKIEVIDNACSRYDV